ncbi:MAG: alpha/beta hydrolase [Rhizobiaceae bacterium]
MAKFLIGILIAYFGMVAMAFLLQNRMLFPAQFATNSVPFNPESGDLLELDVSDKVQLKGIHLKPVDGQTKDKPVILGFGGNAWNAQVAATYLHSLFPANDVVVFHYRGYRPSTGSPTAAHLLSDSLLIFDHLQEQFGTRPIVAIGFSIGSGVAAHLAGNRKLAGLILVTPFDSLRKLAIGQFPWLPVRWLFRHDMEPVDDLRDNSTPTAIIAAENDNVVFPDRTEALRPNVPNLVLDRVITGADHNNIYDRAEFRAAMKEAMALIQAGND